MKNVLMTITGTTLILLSTVSHAKTLPTGVYSGDFGEGKATLFIKSINKDKVKGHSLYRHNYRPLTGSIKTHGNFWNLILNESGTRTGDGQFNIMALKNKPSVLIGNWHAFKKKNKAGITDKNFSLTKTECEYNRYYGDSKASIRLLSDDELYTDPESLDHMINEIYARHGYSFKSPEWASIFAEQDWYVPCYTDVSDKLTSIEKKNIKQMKQRKIYMEKNPISWGR